ncbi:hypothetical protein [Chondromyces apiculatus]|uniref:Uncharacterized protein n=1 Tax=Chondromyces apiculatus DSM 436 TaxID=1192034 RepID=A0A017SVA1_9BACT|nr:hypothetical protein [Chondromyces apiculatus]EYF00899.1 Hypothetical protein CAP_8916 [Chondromyces apiculatus DSM 436]
MRASRDVTLQAGGGVSHGGSLRVAGVDHEFHPGWLATVGGSYRVFQGEGAAPFVLLTASFGASGAPTQERGASTRTDTERYLAIDARLGALAGWTFFDTLTPYLAARVFGGPIFWRFQGRDITGTDRYHYQLALGTTVLLPGGFNVSAEGIPLGERGLSVGVGVLF